MYLFESGHRNPTAGNSENDRTFLRAADGGGFGFASYGNGTRLLRRPNFGEFPVVGGEDPTFFSAVPAEAAYASGSREAVA